MKISLIISCVQNLRVGHWPNFPAIYLYVFQSCSSKFTQLLAALMGNVNHILRSACSPLGQKEPFFYRKLSKLELYCGRESALKTPKNVAKKNDSSLVTTPVLSSCAAQLRVNARSHQHKCWLNSVSWKHQAIEPFQSRPSRREFPDPVWKSRSNQGKSLFGSSTR